MVSGVEPVAAKIPAPVPVPAPIPAPIPAPAPIPWSLLLLHFLFFLFEDHKGQKA